MQCKSGGMAPPNVAVPREGHSSPPRPHPPLFQECFPTFRLQLQVRPQLQEAGNDPAPIPPHLAAPPVGPRSVASALRRCLDPSPLAEPQEGGAGVLVASWVMSGRFEGLPPGEILSRQKCSLLGGGGSSYCCSAPPSCQTLRRPNRLQHARFPCPSPSPGVCSNSCPLDLTQSGQKTKMGSRGVGVYLDKEQGQKELRDV